MIVGASGFVGRHLVAALSADCVGRAVELVSLARGNEVGFDAGLDITDRSAVFAALRRYAPTHVINLAGVAAPAAAAANARASWDIHVHGVDNLADAILAESPDCVLLHVGSGLVYGGSARSGLPLGEDVLLDPADVYGVTKAAGDLSLGYHARRGLKCIRFRPFNHTGPGQTVDFVVPAFAMQIARIEAGLAEPVIRVGNLDAERDFLDVRDVVAAYVLATGSADRIEPGTILNIASGAAVRMSTLLERLLEMSSVAIRVEQDPSRLRPSDLPVIVGNAERARELLDWTPRHSVDEMLASVIADCRQQVATTP